MSTIENRFGNPVSSSGSPLTQKLLEDEKTLKRRIKSLDENRQSLLKLHLDATRNRSEPSSEHSKIDRFIVSISLNAIATNKYMSKVLETRLLNVDQALKAVVADFEEAPPLQQNHSSSSSSNTSLPLQVSRFSHSSDLAANIPMTGGAGFASSSQVSTASVEVSENSPYVADPESDHDTEVSLPQTPKNVNLLSAWTDRPGAGADECVPLSRFSSLTTAAPLSKPSSEGGARSTLASESTSPTRTTVKSRQKRINRGPMAARYNRNPSILKKIFPPGTSLQQNGRSVQVVDHEGDLFLLEKGGETFTVSANRLIYVPRQGELCLIALNSQRRYKGVKRYRLGTIVGLPKIAAKGALKIHYRWKEGEEDASKTKTKTYSALTGVLPFSSDQHTIGLGFTSKRTSFRKREYTIYTMPTEKE